LLFPKQSSKALGNRKSPPSSLTPKNPRAKIDKTQKQLTETEAIREAVQKFASKDPEATAKILKNWIKEK